MTTTATTEAAYYVLFPQRMRNRRWGRGRSKAAAKRRRRRICGTTPCEVCGDRGHNGSCRAPLPRWR